MKYNKFLEDLELIDQDHKNFSIETPLRDDAFEMSDDEKISIIQKNVNEILTTLGMDMTDDMELIFQVNIKVFLSWVNIVLKKIENIFLHQVTDLMKTQIG